MNAGPNVAEFESVSSRCEATKLSISTFSAAPHAHVWSCYCGTSIRKGPCHVLICIHILHPTSYIPHPTSHPPSYILHPKLQPPNTRRKPRWTEGEFVDPLLPMNTPSSTTRFHCSHPGCTRSYKHKEHLLRHKREHINLHKFTCQKCSATFKRR